MSQAMAEMCTGLVFSVHRDVTEIPEVGIFKQVELSTLKGRLRTDGVEAVCQIIR
jgi:hypothetical protein